jgi:hypothetical protein
VFGQKLAIFPGKDVVGHCSNTEPLSKCFAQSQHQSGLS